MSNETIEYGINPSGVLERLTVSSRNPFDIDNSTIGDVSFGTSSGGGFLSFFDAFKDIDPTSALILLGIPAVVSALSGSGAVPTTPGTTTPGDTSKQPGDTSKQPGDTSKQPGDTSKQPGDTGNQPGDTGNQPGDTSKQPGDTSKQPGDTGNQPTADEKSLADTLGIPAATLSTLLKYGLPALASYLSYKSAKDAQEQARGVSFSASGPTTATRTTYGGSRYSAAQGGVASLAGGGIASLAGGGETFQMTDYGSDPRNKEVNWAKLQEDRVRMPEAFEGVLQNLNLNNIPSLYSEIPRSQEELENRDYELYAYYGLPDLASNPPNEYLARIIDDIRNALNVGSIPNREQISTIEANQLYDPVGSASASEMPQFNEEPKIYESNNFTSELSGDLNPAFERELRNWEQTGRWGGGGGGFGKGTGLDFEMSMYSNGGMTTKQPFYLGGSTDGMADEVPAHIDNQRPAALSDGEFVVPADVVSHLGNGNSNAGAKRLYEMMDRIREARTGNSKQGIQVNPNNFMPG